MNKYKNKLMLLMIAGGMLIPNAILAEEGTGPAFDSEAAQTNAKAFIEPLTTFALWAVPLVAGVVWVIAGVMWLAKDEEEKEQKPFLKTSKRIVSVAIITECVPVLLKIFGIA